MIEINHTLLSDEALENLMIDVITRQTTDYQDDEMAVQIKRLKNKLVSGEAVIIYSVTDSCCNIISKAEFQRSTNN